MNNYKTKSGYQTITFKLRLYINATQKLKATQDMYNQTIMLYVNLLMDNLQILQLSNLDALRELEKLTIKSRDGKIPEHYIELDLPVYFRRSAINQAIRYVRSFNAQENRISFAKSFNAPITIYKGMYRSFDKGTMQIKLYDGDKWNWYVAKIKKQDYARICNYLQEGDSKNIEKDQACVTQSQPIISLFDFDSDKFQVQSPSIVLHKNFAMLHVPVKEQISDVTPLKTRMQQEHINVCGVTFSNDNFAVCSAIDEQGSLLNSIVINGNKSNYAKEYKSYINNIKSKIDLNNIKKTSNHKQYSRFYNNKNQFKNKKYYIKINNINDFYAHLISKQIVDFAIKNDCKVISLPDYKDYEYYNYGKFTPFFLSKRIIDYLTYKAFKQEIITTKVNLKYSQDKQQEATNIAVACLKKFK